MRDFQGGRAGWELGNKWDRPQVGWRYRYETSGNKESVSQNQRGQLRGINHNKESGREKLASLEW